MKFYTSVSQQSADHLLVRGYDNDKPFAEKVEYKPTVYVESKSVTNFWSLEGTPMEPMVRENMAGNCRHHHGAISWAHQYIATEWPEENIEYNFGAIRKCYIDIEVASEGAFPSVDEAPVPVTAITIAQDGEYYVFGADEFETNDPKVHYTYCHNEIDLLDRFLDRWNMLNPDIVTGWNCRQFDIPYLVNRLCRIMGRETSLRMSPWAQIEEVTINSFGKKTTVYQLVGIEILDFFELYQKFTYVKPESYKLNYIAHAELGQAKIDYSEYGSLQDLYRQNHQKFIEYNIKDVEIVVDLEKKLKLIETATALSYSMHCNLSDCFTQVRMWDSCIHHYLLSQGIVVPPNKRTEKDGKFAGAYVKEVSPGMHKWVVSFDIASLYPHLIMQYNVSPETLSTMTGESDVDEYMTKSYTKSQGHIRAANGASFFSGPEQVGFLPKLMKKFYADRKRFKAEMIEAQRSGQTDKIASLDMLQMAKKISLNSCFGFLGNQYSRFYDPKLTEAITKTGQLTIRWIERDVNEYLNELVETTGVDYMIAADTDSIYINMEALVDKFSPEHPVQFLDNVCASLIQASIKKSLAELAEYMNAPQMLEMKREVIADRGVWTAKKRYILNVHDNEGVRHDEPKLKIMGIEAVKSSTPEWARDKIKEALTIIMRSTNEKLIEFIAETKAEFSTLGPEAVASPRGVNNLEKYSDREKIYGKKCPIAVRGALLYNTHMQTVHDSFTPIQEGEKVRFVYLLENYMDENVISFPDHLPPELKLHDCIDYDLQFEKVFLNPVTKITDAIEWKTS